MPSAGVRLLTNATTLITAAFPRDTAKNLERGLGCTHSQAERMVKTGRIPQALRNAAMRLLDMAIERNRAELERLQAELRALDYEAMVTRAEDRRSTAACQRDAEIEGQAGQSGQLALIDSEAA